METQEKKVIEHFKCHKSLTSWEAITNYHITRLSAVIYNLRGKGYNINSIREYNEETGTPYARYYLIGLPSDNFSKKQKKAKDKKQKSFSSLFDFINILKG